MNAASPPPLPRTRIGFIGFGEVAGVFSEALVHHGSEVFACDVLATQPDGWAQLARRDRTGAVRFVALEELIQECEWILSTVTTRSAETAARSFAGHRAEGKWYVDLNATSPAAKKSVAAIVAPSGAHFVEGAILSAVGVTGAATRILIGDAAGAASAETLRRLGLNTVFHGTEIGRASAFKLLRSVFSKGIEALLIEFLVAGRRAGVQEELWREIIELFAKNPFERAASNWVQTHALAHERRYHEVVEVAAELRALGLEPVMTAATEAFFQRSRGLGLQEHFAGQDPARDDVVAAIEAALGSKPAAPPAKSPSA